MSGVAIALLDAECHLVSWTPTAQEVLGYPAAEVLNRPARHLLAEGEDADRFEARYAAGTREGWAGVVTARHRDGRRISLGVWTWPLPDPRGEDRWLVAAVDIGHRLWWEADRSMLEQFLARSPVGMAVMDVELREVWLNEALLGVAGIPREERIGKRLTEVLPGPASEAIEEQLRKVLGTGQPVINFQYRGHNFPGDPYRERAFSTSFFRIDDGFGRVLGACSVVLDVTDRWRAEQRLRARFRRLCVALFARLIGLPLALMIARLVVDVVIVFGVADDVQPVATPHFAIVRGCQQPLDLLLVGVVSFVCQEIIHFGDGRGQPDQIQAHPPKQGCFVRFGRGRKSFTLQTRQHKSIDRIAHGIGIFYFR